MDTDSFPQKLEKRSTELLLVSVLLILGTAFTASSGILGQESSGQLVAEYRFDQGAGDTAYDTAGNNDGSLNNFDYDSDSGWANGKFGKALKFDGSDDYVEVSDSSYLEEDSLSLFTWIKPEAIQKYDRIYDKSDSTGGFTEGYRLMLTDTSRLRFEYGNGTAQISIDSNSVVPADEWSWVGATISEAGKAKIFVNGQKETEISVNQTDLSTSTNLMIGRLQGDLRYFDGKMDDIRIYPYALSKSQVRQVYNGGGVNVG